ncbi:MAG: XcyI family restriction endonuclease, partial [Terriglobia bacterium]
EYTQELNLMRSLLIVTALQKREDDRAIRYIREYKSKLAWKPLVELMIDEEVWAYATERQRYDPRLVFSHPDILMSRPSTSLYYRALCGLSLKAVRSYFGSVESLEAGGPQARLTEPKARKMARVYNTFICSIIKNSTDWTLENGRRTILATLGITLDGKMRNRVGRIAEDRVRRLVVDWLNERDLIEKPTITKEEMLREDRIPRVFELRGGITMRFGSEPDIEFTRGNDVLAVVEIKGGIDPAGALERYGAATKSFQHAEVRGARCRNFYLGGVFTAELRRRIARDRLVEKSFDVVEILQFPDKREQFLYELFHHALRLV